MNVEQRRGSNSMGLSIRNLALPPNMVRVDSTVHTNNAPEAASTPEPSAQRPEAASTPEPPAQRFETAATPEQPAQRPETAALELPPLWFVADAAATLSVWDDVAQPKDIGRAAGRADARLLPDETGRASNVGKSVRLPRYSRVPRDWMDSGCRRGVGRAVLARTPVLTRSPQQETQQHYYGHSHSKRQEQCPPLKALAAHGRPA